MPNNEGNTTSAQRIQAMALAERAVLMMNEASNNPKRSASKSNCNDEGLDDVLKAGVNSEANSEVDQTNITSHTANYRSRR
jgi:hypothetical protein